VSQEIVTRGAGREGAARGSSPLVLQTSPYLRQGVTTPGVMVDVLIALAPAVAASIWLFGISGLLVLITATAGAVATEWALSGRRGSQAPSPGPTPIAPGTLGFDEAPRASLAGTLRDGSAPLTGVILGLTLPPSLPLWMAFLGGVVAIALGKAAWGGLGQNLFNPALVGRAFLQAAFPVAITTWVPPQGPFSLYAGNFALPFFQAPPDAVSAATPLNLMKFEQAATPISGLFWGATAGSLGETSVLAMLLGGAWLLLRRACDWRIPASILLSVAALSGALWLASPEG
jgi:Na+-translocating ferredoxin:NAD+ oxidoreductase subunit D